MRPPRDPLVSASVSFRAVQPDLFPSGAKTCQWMSPSWRNLITSPVCEVNRSLAKLCILQASPGVQKASLFLCSAFLSPIWFLSSCIDDGRDKSKTLNVPTKTQMSSQNSASSLGSIQNEAWRKRQTSYVETDLVTLARATWLSTKQSFIRG